MTGCVVTLMALIGIPMLLGARSQISRLEHRLHLVESELRRRIAAGSDVLPNEEAPQPSTVSAWQAPVMEAASAPLHDGAGEPLFATPIPASGATPALLHPSEDEVAGRLDPEANHEPAPKPEPEPEPEPSLGPEPESESAFATDLSGQGRAAQRVVINFEDLFGRKLPIWAGGITLAIAGVLIVKYAIDLGLFARVFSPGVQAICGLLFGLSLIGGAEWAFRKQDKVQDPRVSQSLAGAGISTLYAALLVAANLYGLISPLTAFAGLAVVTGSAMWLSLRHGMPSALLGLAGGLAAPALTVGLDANVSMLAIYLGFTIAGLVGVSRMQRWPWLVALALTGGAGWSLWLVLAGQAMTVIGALSVGTFILMLAIALPLFAFSGARANSMRVLSALVGAVQLAVLVATGGFQPLHWGLFVLIVAAGQWLAWRDRDLAIVPTLGAALSVLLLLIWPDPTAGRLALSGLALTGLLAAPLLARLWSEPLRLQSAIELSAIAAAIPLVVLRHFHTPWGDLDAVGALASLGGAVIALVGAGLGWRTPARDGDRRFALLLAAGGSLLILASWLGLPHWQAPLWIALVAAALLVLAPHSRDRRVEPLAAGFVGLTLPVLLLTMIPARLGEIVILFGQTPAETDLASLLRWVGLAAGFSLFGWHAQRRKIRLGAGLVTPALLYGALAQQIPAWSLPLAMAALAGLFLVVLNRRETREAELLIAPLAIGSVILLGIAGEHPLGEWQQLWGAGLPGPDSTAILRWAVISCLFLHLAWQARHPFLRSATQGATAILVYGAVAQFVPALALPVVPAFGVLAVAAARSRLPWPAARIGAIALAAISVGWAILPLAEWGKEAALSLTGIPMQVTGSELAPVSILRRLLIPAVLFGGALALLRGNISRTNVIRASGLVALASMVALHSLYRAGFRASFGSDFVDYGLGQRLLWDGILLSLALALGKFRRSDLVTIAATGLVAITVFRAIWYSLILHNPLWSAQHVGALPVVNLLLPLFVVLPLALWLIETLKGDWRSRIERVLQPALMISVAMFCWAGLRQVFHGTLLIDPGVTQLEDILRSILGITLAVGYLLWGIQSSRRDWRIASLLLMLAAVAKVFLFDASGLEGLLRIASFIALGFSLIGIGWLYSRQLRSEQPIYAIARPDEEDAPPDQRADRAT